MAGVPGTRAADLVGQLLQVGFERGRLLGLGDHAIGCVLGKGSAEEDSEKQDMTAGLVA